MSKCFLEYDTAKLETFNFQKVCTDSVMLSKN